MPTQTYVFQDGYIVFRILVIRILNLFSPWDSLWRISSLGFRPLRPRAAGVIKNAASIAPLNKRDTPQDALRRKYDIRTTRYFFCKTNPISTRPTMNLNPYNKRTYENFIPLRTMKNEPKTKPIQTQFTAASPRLHAGGSTQTSNRQPNSNPKQTQSSAASPRLHAGGSTQTSNRRPIFNRPASGKLFYFSCRNVLTSMFDSLD